MFSTFRVGREAGHPWAGWTRWPTDRALSEKRHLFYHNLLPQTTKIRLMCNLLLLSKTDWTEILFACLSWADEKKNRYAYA